VWEIKHGGPTHRTLSAIEYLTDLLADGEAYRLADLAEHLLDAFVESRGLQNLGGVLAPLPDETETVVQQVNENMDAIGDAVKNFRKLPR
jgi:hypothetical protein